MKQRQKLIATCALAIVALAARSVTLTVPGTSCPWLAGMPDGSTGGCGLDRAPEQSPVLVTGLTLDSGFALTFSASGGVWYEGGTSRDGPDGSFFLTSAPSCGPENGIAGISAPGDSLLGVFLDAAQPNLSVAPDTFAYMPDTATVAPGLKQAFFIGDGRTSSGTVQQFVIPAGATRLYLGTVDGYGWYNNVGSFSVEVLTGPLLNIVWLGVSQVRLSWSTNAAGYSLECATNLPAAGWSTVTNQVTTNANRLFVTVETDGPQRFYRLRQP